MKLSTDRASGELHDFSNEKHRLPLVEAED